MRSMSIGGIGCLKRSTMFRFKSDYVNLAKQKKIFEEAIELNVSDTRGEIDRIMSTGTGLIRMFNSHKKSLESDLYKSRKIKAVRACMMLCVPVCFWGFSGVVVDGVALGAALTGYVCQPFIDEIDDKIQSIKIDMFEDEKKEVFKVLVKHMSAKEMIKEVVVFQLEESIKEDESPATNGSWYKRMIDDHKGGFSMMAWFYVWLGWCLGWRNYFSESHLE